MEWMLFFAGAFLILVAVAGSLLPLLPGPPLAFAGLLLQQLREPAPYTTGFLVLWAAITLTTVVLDYWIPIWGAKKYGGSRYGVWGCTLGLLAGWWLGPLGVLLAPLTGTFIGEWLAHQNIQHALRAAWGSFIGFLAGSLLKVLLCFIMLFYLLQSWPGA